ncbi:MAG: hypothetical protein GY943_29535 [Chloroflexi bacterium]|nr:hypothetical protein [Chloroflexota bacterium]
MRVLIINILSGAGSITMRNSLASYSYGASKAALNFYIIWVKQTPGEPIRSGRMNLMMGS